MRLVSQKKLALDKVKKRIKIDPFTPENSAFPEFPVEFSTDFSFSPSVVGASLFDIHALVYSLSPGTLLSQSPLLYIKFRLFYIYMTSNLFLCPWLWDRKRVWPFQIWKILLFRSENFQVFQFAEKWLFPKLTFSLLKSENVQGSKTLILRFLMFFDFWDKIKRKCSTIAMIFGGYIKGIKGHLPC